MNKIAINIHIQAFVCIQIFNSLGKIARGEITGSYGS